MGSVSGLLFWAPVYGCFGEILIMVIFRQNLLYKILEAEVDIILLLRAYHIEPKHLPQYLLSLFTIFWFEIGFDFEVILHYLRQAESLKRS